MKIGVLLPFEQQKTQAGVRIRYSRIESALQRLGHQLELIPIQNLTSGAACVHDIYVLSKCYDARSLVIARYLNQAGKPVGVDLFDDYFSQYSDSRFVRLRYWLRALASRCSFIMCSTPRMRELAHEYAPGVPVHVMNDPAAMIDVNTIAAATKSKLETARNNRCIDVAWFGMGDNPNFPLGLADLAAFGGEVDRLRGHGYDVRMEVLTNRRAMTPDYLAALRCLATPYTLEEWDEARERELLSRSLISFLPVNAQNFSRVKSQNRAVTALSAGVQVLSAGYPLYEPFAPFIYRDSRQFLQDLRSGKLALREETAQSLADRLNSLADTEYEASALVEFFAEIRRAPGIIAKPGTSAVIHGKETTSDVHKFAQRMGTLSVASPFCRADLNFDVRFAFAAEGVGFDIYIANKRVDRVSHEIKAKLVPHGNMLTTAYKTLRSETTFPNMRVQGAALSALNTLAGDSAAYPAVMNSVVEVMRRLFPGVTCFYAEQSHLLPWHAATTDTVMESEVRQ